MRNKIAYSDLLQGINATLIEKGISKKKVHQILGGRYQSILGRLSGKQPFYLEDYLKLCHALDVDPIYFFRKTEPEATLSQDLRDLMEAVAVRPVQDQLYLLEQFAQDVERFDHYRRAVAETRTAYPATPDKNEIKDPS